MLAACQEQGARIDRAFSVNKQRHTMACTYLPHGVPTPTLGAKLDRARQQGFIQYMTRQTEPLKWQRRLGNARAGSQPDPIDRQGTKCSQIDAQFPDVGLRSAAQKLSANLWLGRTLAFDQQDLPTGGCQQARRSSTGDTATDDDGRTYHAPTFFNRLTP
jgi:hypothetical protein